MTPGLRPLRDRVLIQPEASPTQTASGLHLIEHWKPEQMGTVIAVGRAAHPNRADAITLAELLENASYGPNSAPRRAAGLLRQLAGPLPAAVMPGDQVIFGWNVGQEIFVENERYFLMREDDICAIVEA